jgi:hypothetical protein
MSGVKAIYYRIAGENWKNHTGDFLVFIVDYDCLVGLIEFYSVDYAGNHEEIKSVEIAIDQKPPEIELTWEVYKEGGVWLILFTAKVEDACSGINRLEFYLNDILLDTITGPGPYIWSIPTEVEGYSVFGLICNQEITEENISFFALVVWTSVQYSYSPWKDIAKIKVYDNAGNWVFYEIIDSSPPGPKTYFFTHFTFQNKYEGYIGRFLIYAIFEKEPYSI